MNEVKYMARYKTSGWKGQKQRHSNAKKYGRAGGVYANQLKKGIKVESEHSKTLNYVKNHPKTPIKDAKRMIAKDHLQEDPLYYNKLKLIENGTLRTIPPPPLKQANNLPVQVSIIVPSTKLDKKIQEREFQKRINEEKKYFDTQFGGDTSINTLGSYVMDGKLIKEKGAKIESSMSAPTYQKKIKNFAKHAEEKRKQWQQDTVLIGVEGKNFITPRKDYIDDDKRDKGKRILIT